MSSVDILGLICNIFQVISFARETKEICTAIYDGQSPSDFNGESAASLSAFSAQLQARHQNSKSQTPEERELEDIVRKCNVAARALEDEIKFLDFHQARRNLRQTLRIALKTIWRKQRLQRLERSLLSYQRTMETHILGRICTQSQASELRHHKDFRGLKEDLQLFISQIAHGHTKMEDLVKKELASIHDHTESLKRDISGEINTAQQGISTHITRGNNKILEGIFQTSMESNALASTKQQRDRLLQSLRYPAMNERKNDLTDSYEGTFRWIFVDDLQNGSESSSSDCASDLRLNRPTGKPWGNFSDWLKSNSKIYWISGKPGSGKSTLMKYLLQSHFTKVALGIRAANTVILSHFFWKPGTKMQNNIKGFLCSILYQCLSLSVPMLDSLLITFESLSPKESVTDWSTKELENVCLAVLRGYTSPICIFIDGLDEVCELDGPHTILNLVDELQAIPNIKICVASRPEPLLDSALSKHQHLRLQDLTGNDMWHYANARLQPYVDMRRISQHFGYATVISTLLFKAQGVFLWLRLATRSLIYGIENGDTECELQRRLQELPSELSDLYSDMWERLNGDSQSYRETAARYFNLVITEQGLSDWKSRYNHTQSLVHIMAATETQVQYTFINDMSITGPEMLEGLCNTALHAIHIRCAGMLEVVRRQDNSSDMSTRHARDRPKVLDPTYRKLLPCAAMNVQFIHRSAYDFITGTEDGCRILSHDTTSKDTLYINLIKGELVCAKILQDVISHDVRPLLEYASHAMVQSPEAEVHHLLRIAWNWYDNKYYSPGWFVTDDNIVKLRPHFLVVATVFPRLHGFIISSVTGSSNPAALAGEILRNIHYDTCIGIFDDYPTTTNFIRELLRLCSNIRCKGICYSISRTQPFPFLSPFSYFIQKIFLGNERVLWKDVDYLRNLLWVFFEANPDPDERIPLLISFTGGCPTVTYIEQRDSFSHQRIDLSYYEQAISEYVLLDFKAAFLSRIVFWKIIGVVPSLAPLPPEELQATQNDSEGSLARVLLISFSKPAYTGSSTGWRFRPTTETATAELLALVLQFLAGDISEEWGNRMRSEFTKIRRDLVYKPDKYEGVYKTAREVLVEEGCGYSFVDENGHPREVEENDDGSRCSNDGGPFEDRFRGDYDYYRSFDR